MGWVWFIGDFDMCICEDYLCILRFFWIFVVYGCGDLDFDGFGVCLC